MPIHDALERLAVLEVRGWGFHYTSCGIYHHGLFTVPKAADDPTRICTCGRDEAVAVVAASHVGQQLARHIGRVRKPRLPGRRR